MASLRMAADTMASLHRILPRQNQTGDENIGSAQAESTTSVSASQLYSTLLPTFIIFAVYIGIFLILRRIEDRHYAPRTYLGSVREEDRTPPLPKGFFSWFFQMQKIPDTWVLQHNSLDGYFLLRFLKIAIITCLVGCCITFPVLFAVNATGGGSKKQLDMLNFANISRKNHYYAPAACAWAFIGFVFFMITRESIYYINLRQAYLLSPMYANRLSSRTVLFSSVPDDYTNPEIIRRMFGSQLKNVWISSDTKELEDKVSERDKIAFKLEGAETKLIKLANQARIKGAKSGQADGQSAADVETGADSGSVAAKYIPQKQRPTHRLKPIIGKKVDTINWSRLELQRLNPEIETIQATHRMGEAKTVSSVFVEFYNQTDAQAAFQMVAHHKALHMSPRVIGMTPGDVIWSNLRIRWWERVIRNFLTIGAVALTILFWSIPVAFVGSISNLQALTERLKWLGFINKVPDAIKGVITGLLPSILLAVLMALLPIYLRLMARLGGMPTWSTVELRTQNFYFWFQVIQVFLVASFSSAASAVTSKIISDPTKATSLLAENLPLAANFYISFFILQGLVFSSGAILHIVGVVIFKVLGKILDNTPRKMYKRWVALSGVSWGTVFPILSNLVVIAIVYSVIQPLVIGFATIGLTLFYLAWRYNLLFVNAAAIDTKGLVYPRALQHITVGCYLCVLCLIGLLGIAKAPGPLVITVVLLIVMVLYHISLNAAISPLLHYLPRSLEAEEEALLQSIRSEAAAGETTGKEAGKGTANGSPQAPAPHKANFITRFFRPDLYADFQTMRRLVPHTAPEVVYEAEVEKNAYYHPAIVAAPPLLWIPRDPMGVSRQEVAHTDKVHPITDEGAGFDEKGKIIWDQEHNNGRSPIWEPYIPY